MAIRILSDLHLEFGDFELPPLDTDKDDVLVLAGDIAVTESPKTFARVKEWAESGRFKKIIHVCGNHEYYGGSLLRVRTKLREMFEPWKDNIAIATNNSVVRVDDISFVCATLWTDYNRGNPMTMNIVHGALNDYKYIRTGNYGAPYLRKTNPHDMFSEFTTSKHFIFKSIKEEKYIDGQKIVVVSHHGPSTLSIHDSYKGDPVNWGYVSDLWNDIADAKPNMWIHGHTHHSFDYMIEDTRVLVNPRGYLMRLKGAGYADPVQFFPENGDFNPTLRVEV